MAVITMSRATDPLWQNLLVESLMDIPDADGVSASTLAVAWRSARSRVQLLRELRPVPSRELAVRLGSRERQIERWAESGRVFSLDREGILLFPMFQFTSDGTPHAAMEQILDALRFRSGWDVATWFTSRSESLDDRRPIDVFRESPGQVVDAAHRDGALIPG